MHLTNRTAATAELIFGEQGEGRACTGVIVAKATFRLDDSGRPVLDTESAYPIFRRDVSTPLGLLPRDDLPRTDPAFEVILLGRAHRDPNSPGARHIVALTVGDHRRELMVYGDRSWTLRDDTWAPTAPADFTTVDLSWSNAFGGKVEVLIDRDAYVDVVHQGNPSGKGFDPTASVTGLAADLGCPEGYPRWEPALALPNIEDPRRPIARREDAPPPACWATLPMSSALHVERAIVHGSEPRLGPGMFHRAHPEWVIDLPEKGARVRLEGMAPGGATSDFALPAIRVIADYVVGARSGRRELIPQMLVLLPEERRFYLVYRRRFAVERKPGEQRALRLRLARGWRGARSRGQS